MAGDKIWLQDFADQVIPRYVADFEKLQQLHYDSWHTDYKTHGYERIMYRYAGTIARLHYTAQLIRRYLAGALSVIEELEPEVLHTGLPKWFSAQDFMYISPH